MREISLPNGATIDYVDTGSGPTLLLLHGAFMNETLWTDVVSDLADDHRCVVPVLPLGGHQTPMPPGSDLSPSGIARLIGQFVERLGLTDVTLMGNDTGGALAQYVAVDAPPWLARLVLTSCDAFDNFPPGLPGKLSTFAATMPAGLWGAAHTMRVRPLTRLPLTFGWMAKRPIPDSILLSWFAPMRADAAVRRDAREFLHAVRRREMAAVSEQLASFERPTLLPWATEDKVTPRAHADRLAQLLPDARVVDIADSYTLTPLDQPRALASAVRDFVAA